ncbi:MAG: acyltransferase [Opitutaceae bacterium]|jgi:peptidoglycan/LPS O-acetylase OafA/YrhL
MNKSRRARDPNLDLLRALAISAVVVAHLVVMSPVHRPGVIAVIWAGQFGVDLFFVLSGWLIGGLYFREWQTRGSVRPVSFILRRAWRTVPPYYVALAAAWSAAHFFRNDHPPFSIGYLFFLQNYFGRLPFFAVSWSLCVEEHFYLVLPLLFCLLRKKLDRLGAFFFLALGVSPFCRCYFHDSPSIDVFDSSVFATHVHLDGLVIGVWAAWSRAFRPEGWTRLAAFGRTWAWLAAALLALVYWVPARLFYCIGYTYISVLLAMLLAACADRPALPGAATAWIRAIALTSYSVYLTHALVLQAALRLSLALPAGREEVYYGLALAGTAMAGAAFYFMVERPSIRWRDRIVPHLPERSADAITP